MSALTGACLALTAAAAAVRVGRSTSGGRGSRFRLGLGPDQGNCDLCFLKGKQRIIRLMREDPARARWWIDLESPKSSGQVGEPMRFRPDYTYADLLRAAEGSDPEPPGPAEESMPCFCTD